MEGQRQGYYWRVNMQRLREFSGLSLDAPTRHVCPCHVCHTADDPRVLIVAEYAMGGCTRCQYSHAPIAQERPHERDELMELHVAGVPPRYRDMRWSSWKGPVPAGLEQWDGEPDSVLIFGPPGTGKTHLAVAMLVRWLERRSGARVSARFEDAVILTGDIKREFDVGGHATEDRVRRADLLVLDDMLGQRRPTEWERTQLADVLRWRHMHARPVIVTTNLEPSQLAGSDPAMPGLDARVASRLGEGKVVRRLEGDWRMKGAVA